MEKLTKKQEQSIAIIASILLIFSCMLDPRITLAISTIAILAYFCYQNKVSNKK